MSRRYGEIYEQILKERERLECLSKEVVEELSVLPEGKLIFSHDGNRCKFYCKKDNERIYLGKNKHFMKEKLARKRYLSLLLEDVEHEKRALDFYLRHHSKEVPKSLQFLSDMPEYRELLATYYKPVSKELEEWKEEAYERNPKYQEHLIHKSVSGNLVRSKSEWMIDMMLYTNRIPFRYECALQLGDITLYPDFTIRHPQTGELFYWEHFGSVDNVAYCKSVCSKLQLYMTHGIIPTVNLITTYETKEKPFTLEVIEQVLGDYFLKEETKIYKD